jgi:hypothetical protein
MRVEVREDVKVLNLHHEIGLEVNEEKSSLGDVDGEDAVPRALTINVQ